MSLDAEAIREIQALVNAARKPSYLASPFKNDCRTAHVSQDGKIAETLSPGPRRYSASSVAGIIEQINDLAASVTGACRVFVGEDRTVAVFNERDQRCHRATFECVPAESFSMLSTGDLIDIDQKRLVWLIRSMFPRAVAPDSFLPSIRVLKFGGTSGAVAGVHHGRESMGAEVERSVAGTSDAELPEVVILNTPVLEPLAGAFSAPVRCAVYIDCEDKAFTIKPEDGQLVLARRLAVQYIAETIRAGTSNGDDVTVFESGNFG